MEKIPSAFDFWCSRKGTEDGDIVNDLIDFAKLHVEAALKAASDNAKLQSRTEFVWGACDIIDKESILTAYPLENIK